MKGKIFSAYGVTVDKEPGRRKKVVNTARDDDASGLTALLRIEHLAGGFWQFSFRQRQGTSSSAVRWEKLSLELERKLEKKVSLEFCCRGSRYKDLSFRDFFFLSFGLGLGHELNSGIDQQLKAEIKEVGWKKDRSRDRGD